MENNIIFFKSQYDYDQYVQRQKLEPLGYGAEGMVFLTKDHSTIKQIRFVKYNYPLQDLIMASDYNLESFLFPKELYIHNNNIIGYKTDYFYNIFRELDGNIKDIDLDALVEAGYIMIEDIKEISKDHIILHDMPYNLLFNGKRLRAIDTLSYYKETGCSYQNILKENIILLKDALIAALKFHDEYCSMAEKDHFTKVLTKHFGSKK